MDPALKTIGELLGPTKPVVSVERNARMLEALRLMAEYDIGAVLVMEGGRLVGIVTERDYARKGIITGRAAKDTPVADVMTFPVVYVTPERTIPQCMAVMAERNIRHLPVLAGDDVKGVVSISDLVREVISHQQHLIRQLERDRLALLTPSAY